MGRRERKRTRDAVAGTSQVHPGPREGPAEDTGYTSGLLNGQTDPVIREVLTGISRRLRAQYGTADSRVK